MSAVLVRITAPHFCAGLVVGQRAAPILRFMAAWPLSRIEGYCKSKRWQCEVGDTQSRKERDRG